MRRCILAKLRHRAALEFETDKSIMLGANVLPQLRSKLIKTGPPPDLATLCCISEIRADSSWCLILVVCWFYGSWLLIRILVDNHACRADLKVKHWYSRKTNVCVKSITWGFLKGLQLTPVFFNRQRFYWVYNIPWIVSNFRRPTTNGIYDYSGQLISP